MDGVGSPAGKKVEDQPACHTNSINRLGTPVASFEEYKQRLKAAPYLGPYWNSYFDLYFEHDVRHRSDGSVVSKAYREGVLEDNKRQLSEGLPERQWKHVTVPTLLLLAVQGLFSETDQLLPEE